MSIGALLAAATQVWPDGSISDRVALGLAAARRVTATSCEAVLMHERPSSKAPEPRADAHPVTLRP